MKIRCFGLEKIFFLFNICKQNVGKIVFFGLEFIENKGFVKIAWENEQFSSVKHKKFNKSNFLFYIYCIFRKVGYNE